MSFKSKITVLKHVGIGYLKKWAIDTGVTSVPCLSPKPHKGAKIVVSLTSYGRRVKNCVVYYTLVSLLRQTVQPDRIILWLDDSNWNAENIPAKLKQLQEKGVEIAFCKDLRSYKKLVPALTFCPEDTVITVDDDMIYYDNLIESLIKSHQQNPHHIICRQCRFPNVINEELAPYNTWIAAPKTTDNQLMIMPLGVSGVLYPPKSLHPDVTRQDLFSDLCPLADDMWFWIMAKRNNTNHLVIAQTQPVGDSFDDLYQYFHKGSALTHSNRKENKNDIQVNNLIKHFKIKLADLYNIS